MPASFVLHHTRAADHFQVSDFRKIGQNFVLHAVGKEGVLLFVAQIIERQNRNAFLGKAPASGRRAAGARDAETHRLLATVAERREQQKSRPQQVRR